MRAVQNITAYAQKNPAEIFSANVTALDEWRLQWKIALSERKAFHKSGVAVEFGRYNVLAPVATRYIIGVEGLQRLNGTRWEGQADALLNQALWLWRDAQ